MLNTVPFYVSLTFGLTTLATLGLFYWILKNSDSQRVRQQSRTIMIGLVVWLMIQAVLTWSGVYHADTAAIPPKIVLFGILPAILTIVYIFVSVQGRHFIDSLSLKHLTILHVVRIPVEIVLFWLFVYKAIPQLMTFEGRNFDILAGITAPFAAYFGVYKTGIRRNFLLGWNVICIGLLVNIVVNALFSTPSPFQKFAFEQPNIAILYFPFSWLPTFIVPIVLLSHLISVRQLTKRSREV